MKNQVDEQIKKNRVSELSALAGEIRRSILDSLEGTKTEVLFETLKDGYAYGHTAEFVEVKAECKSDIRGEVHKVEILSNDGDICLCRLI